MPYRIEAGTRDEVINGFHEAVFVAQRWAMRMPGITVELFDLQSRLKLRSIWWDKEAGRLQTVEY